jgi:hypothetical protein
MHDQIESQTDSTLSKVFGWIAAVIGFGFLTILLLGVIQVSRFGFFDQLVLEHVISTLGLPCAAFASLILVLILRTVSGKIELKIIGMEFKGASGPIIMWVICFLAMTLALAKTWDLTYKNKQFDSVEERFVR